MSRSRASRLLALLAAITAIASLAASPAQAASNGDSLLGCGYNASHPFMRFLDPLPYTLLPDGGFEAGGAGWTLSGGARVAAGNEPWNVSGPGSRSLMLPARSSATSPPMCMGLVLPVVRFFSSGGSLLSYMQVDALYKDAAGRQRSIMLLPIGLPSGGWIPNLPMLQLGGALNALTLNGLTTDIQLRFTPRGGLFGSGTWRIDDVYVDPWKVV
ncbi:MAG TPA: hypothetical protein VNP89_10280 [Gaiellaceae bacterium]|nr:hypothetical protein [Gaiellaceae bacterium]